MIYYRLHFLILMQTLLFLFIPSDDETLYLLIYVDDLILTNNDTTLFDFFVA